MQWRRTPMQAPNRPPCVSKNSCVAISGGSRTIRPHVHGCPKNDRLTFRSGARACPREGRHARESKVSEAWEFRPCRPKSSEAYEIPRTGILGVSVQPCENVHACDWLT